MTTALVAAVLPDADDRETKTVADLTGRDRGRLAAIETPSGLFYGFIGSIIHHRHGKVQVGFEHQGFDNDTVVPDDHPIHLSTIVRRDES